MIKKNIRKKLEPFLSPLVMRLVNEYDLSMLEKIEIEAIKEVEVSGGNCLLCVSRWDGRARKNWSMSSIKNTPHELESLVSQMLEATNPDDAFEAYLYDDCGNAWELLGETVKVKYDLVEI